MAYTKAELKMFNEHLDRTCVDLTEQLSGARQENEILKGIISLMMMGNECNERMIKLAKPDPLYIKIENDYCIIVRGEMSEESIQTEQN